LTPLVGQGQIRFVLSWSNGPKDLDIHSIFKISDNETCEVYFGKRDCLGTELNTDTTRFGSNGVQTLTINTLGKYNYTIAVNKYIHKNSFNSSDDKPIKSLYQENSTPSGRNVPVQNLPLSKSNAQISVYIDGYREAIYKLKIQNILNKNDNGDKINVDSFNWWWAFCLDGNKGLNNIKAINRLTSESPGNQNCENV